MVRARVRALQLRRGGVPPLCSCRRVRRQGFAPAPPQSFFFRRLGLKFFLLRRRSTALQECKCRSSAVAWSAPPPPGLIRRNCPVGGGSQVGTLPRGSLGSGLGSSPLLGLVRQVCPDRLAGTAVLRQAGARNCRGGVSSPPSWLRPLFSGEFSEYRNRQRKGARPPSFSIHLFSLRFLCTRISI